MKFISTNQLNELYEKFEEYRQNSRDFQSFVEGIKDNGKVTCINTEDVQEFLENLHDEDYDYLLECDDKDMEVFGEDYLKRINFIRKLLGAKEDLTIKDIKQDRRES